MHDSDEKPRFATPSGNTVTAASRGHAAEKYQGKRLLHLVLAICLPAALLYLRLVCGLAATDTRIAPRQSLWLTRFSTAALLLFFIAQLASAHYVQRLLHPRQTAAGNTLQYLAVLAFCILLSLTGAVVLEAFGFDLFLRAATVH